MVSLIIMDNGSIVCFNDRYEAKTSRWHPPEACSVKAKVSTYQLSNESRGAMRLLHMLPHSQHKQRSFHGHCRQNSCQTQVLFAATFWVAEAVLCMITMVHHVMPRRKRPMHMICIASHVKPRCALGSSTWFRLMKV